MNRLARHRLPAARGVLGLALLLAACASGPTPEAITADGPDDTATAIELCSLVTPAEVQAALGQALQAVATTNMEGDNAYPRCSFGDSQSGRALELEMTLGPQAASHFKASLENARQAQGALPVAEATGADYQAYSIGAKGQLIQTAVLKGDVEVVFVVFQNNGATFDTDKALDWAQAIAGRLP